MEEEGCERCCGWEKKEKKTRSKGEMQEMGATQSIGVLCRQREMGHTEETGRAFLRERKNTRLGGRS